MEYDDAVDPTKILRCPQCQAIVFVILDNTVDWYDEFIGKLDRHNWLVGHRVESF